MSQSHALEAAGTIVSGIDVDYPPQPPRRRCAGCYCFLRSTKALDEDRCDCCQRKEDKRLEGKR